jgi:hypothetical protein
MESNRIIAEFMGWNIQNPTTIPTNLHLSNLELDNGEVMELKFNTSWDWLMPAVSKCRNESDSEDSNWEDIYYTLEECNLHTTHKAVVEFIKNQNN